ncbi:Metallo-dependent hydrolase [Stipitochalara longipes BDJ]|nr:Metallo-dependent hydrolase [Stipitochalara longipes BDJ]
MASHDPKPYGTIYKDGTIITVNQQREVFLEGAVHVLGNRIYSVGTTEQVFNALYHVLAPGVPEEDIIKKIEIVNLKQKIVIPGLINVHAHIGHSLMRGLSQELESLVSTKLKYEDDDELHAATLSIAEMLKSGTTCFLDPVSADEVEFVSRVQAVNTMGIRGCLALFLAEPLVMKEGHEPSMLLEEAVMLRDRFLYSVERLSVWLSAPAPTEDKNWGNPTFYEEIDNACRMYNMRLTLHATYAPAHINTQVNSHIATLLAQRINVVLGTDSAASCHTFDLFQEMHVAGLIQKGPLGSSDLVSAEQVLEMATINGAKALGLEREIGSLEIGKKADLVVVNPFGLHAAPYHPDLIDSGGLSPVTTVVRSCTASDVSLVVVDGVVLVRDGKIVIDGVNEEEIIQNAKDAIRRVRERSDGNAQRQPLKSGWNLKLTWANEDHFSCPELKGERDPADRPEKLLGQIGVAREIRSLE